jgi:hypothetical protein
MTPAFNQIVHDARTERRKYPLHEGIFKLQEGHHTLLGIYEEIQAIAAYKRKEVNKYALQMCQTSEIASWLRTTPTYLARVLFRTVLPAFSALGADGVPADTVSALEREAAERISGIVASLDAAQAALANPIDQEYKRMKNGKPTLAAPILAAIDLIDATLRLAESYQSAR